MSASEKLKALDAQMGGEDNEDAAYWLGRKMQEGLLPQIVAVVEAAEAAQQTETVSELDEDDYTVWYERPVDVRDQIQAALAALEEALQ